VRRVASFGFVTLLVAAAAIAGYAVKSSQPSDSQPVVSVPTETVAVVRTDLVQVETLQGRLEYGDRRVVRSGRAGTITWMPGEATRLERGSMAFEVDGVPVVVMIGDRPAWRSLADGVDDGQDIRQLEENLVALGFGPEDWEPDEEFDADTGDAVEDWRAELGLPESDGVELGEVLFTPDPIRVGSHIAAVGDPVSLGGPVFDGSGLAQQVVLDLDPTDLELVAEGMAATVVLPTDERIDGTITRVGRVVRQSGPEPDAAGVIEVVIDVGPTRLDLDGSPVDVEIESERAAGVLAVPVRALIALSDGGYAVEVGDNLIGVETGDFAGGLVEIRGAIDEGDLVIVPR